MGRLDSRELLFKRGRCYNALVTHFDQPELSLLKGIGNTNITHGLSNQTLTGTSIIMDVSVRMRGMRILSTDWKTSTCILIAWSNSKSIHGTMERAILQCQYPEHHTTNVLAFSSKSCHVASSAKLIVLIPDLNFCFLFLNDRIFGFLVARKIPSLDSQKQIEAVELWRSS